jgi:preprotein translocase subunit SecB
LPEKLIDYAAVGRVSKRVELKNILLSEIVAKCNQNVIGPLEAQIDSECSVHSKENQKLEILCNYKFAARAAESEIAHADIKYLVIYEMRGAEPVEDGDLAEFATANGTVHTWPFVREFIYGLTSRMGYPPYTLPVVHFVPKPAEEKPKPANMSESKPLSPPTKG